MGFGASLILLAVGAILAFAVTLDPTPVAGMTVEWDTVGVILLLLGVVALIWSVAMLNAVKRGRTDVIVDERIDPRV